MELSPQRSTFVTGLAIVSMLLGAFLFVSDIAGLVSYVNLTNSSEYQMAMKLMQAYQPDSGLMLINSEWMMTTSIIGLVLNMGTLVVSYGLFARKTWGRTSFISLLGIQTMYYILSSIGGYYLAQTIVNKSGVGETLDFSGLWAFGGFATIVGMIIVVATAAFIIRKLSSDSVRQEFVQQQASSVISKQ
jgi:hypothetical protein